ncbi:HAD-IA family hydrolase [Luteolibacter flavescens]|uniref:HAD-IA family hydrolase n=1 Tax=Luteolibacter flavescens TaxID=1859460 RepID=A0ABT3FMI4_9BACT|nr:HAD-IA family hydrolase [Luteolibacter flavescens]MCW1884784.1 HAD-IA family hydrolase [Luteolibacter flavescens]
MNRNFRKLVGIRFPQWSSYGPRTMEGVVESMRQHETWRIATENDSYGEMEAVKIDEHWHGDGLVLFRATERELASYRERGTAVVLTSTEGPDLGYPRVVPDNHEIGRLAAHHLIECQLPHFAFLARGETFYREEQYAPGLRVYARQRLKGFRAGLQEYRHEPVVHYLRGRPLWESHGWREVQTEVMAFLESLPEPCGLFVADDSLAAVVLRAADMLGRQVPEQLAVIGYGDDAAYCFATFPALSSIEHPAREIGRQAAELLRRQMAGEAVEPGSLIVPVSRVITRESSDMLAITDPDIRELVRYIRLRAPHEAVRVAELTDLTPLSMTTIKERFAAALGHGPKEEIQRVRARHLKHLLGDLSLTLAEIARRMQFGSAHELSRFFLAETGQRPSDFRASLSASAAHVAERAVVFDMDGTLFDTEPVYCEAYRTAFARQGGELTKDEYFRELVGRSNEDIEEYLAAKAPRGFDLAGFRSGWREDWRVLVNEEPPVPMPGVAALLEEILEAGVPLALASSSDREDIDLCLQASGLDRYFPIRASGDEVAAGKPAPDLYLLACRRLGIGPTRCLAIEDSRHGVAAALSAGLAVAQVLPNGGTAREGVRGVASLTELLGGEWQTMVPRDKS